jgi:hypothetical protein
MSHEGKNIDWRCFKNRVQRYLDLRGRKYLEGGKIE